VEITKIMKYCGKTFVGRFSGKMVKVDSLASWFDLHWAQV
jgi:hypothetical protein